MTSTSQSPDLFSVVPAQEPDLGLLPLLATAAPTESLPPLTDGLVLRRVTFNPVHLGRGAVLATAFAAEHGATDDERDTLALFVREDTCLLAMDLVRDGRTCRFRFRMPVDAASLNDGPALAVGVRVRGMDLVQALRSRVENSERYGILPSQPPAILEVVAHEGRPEEPQAVQIIPTHTQGSTPRVVRALGGAEVTEFVDLEPEVAETGLAEITPELLLETGNITHPDVGVLVDPREVDRPGVAVGVGPDGVLLSTFTGVPFVSGTTPSTGARRLHAPVVLSRRLALMTGHAQAAMNGALETAQKQTHNEVMAHVIAAALTAAMQTDPTRVREQVLYRSIGQKAATTAKAAARKATESALEGAVAMARALVAGVAPAERPVLHQRVRETLGTCAPLPAGLRDQLLESTGDDAVIAGLAEHLLAHGGMTEPVLDACATACGEVRLRPIIRTLLLTRVSQLEAEPQITTADVAVAAVRHLGTRSAQLVDQLLALVLPAERAAWWTAFADGLSQLGIPTAVMEALLSGRVDAAGQAVAPTASRLALPDAYRRAALREAGQAANGRLWATADGRVFAGMGTPDTGILTLSDVATQPDPLRFPLGLKDIARALHGDPDFAWHGSLYTEDLVTVTDRVVGLQGANAFETGRAAAGLATSLFVGRWTPATPDGVTDAVRAALPREVAQRPATPETVYVGSGRQEVALQMTRDPRLPAASAASAGVLRIFGFDVTGERLYYEIPIRAMTQRPSTPFSFALDASRLHDFVSYLTLRGRNGAPFLLMQASPGGVRLSGADGRSVIVFPTVQRSLVHPSLRTLLEVAAVRDGVPVPMAVAAAHVRALPRRVPVDEPVVVTRRSDRKATPGRFVQWRPTAPAPTVPGTAPSAMPATTGASPSARLSPAQQIQQETQEVVRRLRLAGQPAPLIVAHLSSWHAEWTARLATLDREETRPRGQAAGTGAPVASDLFGVIAVPEPLRRRSAKTVQNARVEARHYLTAIEGARAEFVTLSTAAPSSAGAMRAEMAGTAFLTAEAEGSDREDGTPDAPTPVLFETEAHPAPHVPVTPVAPTPAPVVRPRRGAATVRTRRGG